MSDTCGSRTAFIKAFVFTIAYLAVTGWALSEIHELRWLGIFSVPGMIAAVVLARRWAGPKADFRNGIFKPLTFWPFILLIALVLLCQALYLPTMLDSLTYRLPRIFAWLQHDSLRHFASAEDRLNYMPQTWELATIPLVQLANDRLVWFWTFASWIVLYLLAYDWAFDLCGNDKKSKVMAFIASTSTFAILQSASSANDLFAGALALLALRFVVNFERTRNGREINWAVLSFCIAAGTKPHFAVFGLPLAVWFFVSPSKPWQKFDWIWLPLLLPVWLLCSPAPSFILNHQTYGTWGGPGQDYSMKGGSPAWNIALGAVMIVEQNLQPPVNPFALKINKKMDRLVDDSGLKKIVPRFNLRCGLLALEDGAALGLVTSILFAMGMIVAFRRDSKMWRSWSAAAALAGLICIPLGLSHFVSGGSGRAYCGFLYFGLPLAMAGWNWMKPATLKWGLYLSLASGLISVVLAPSHPLWPVRWVQEELARSPRFDKFAAPIKIYRQFSERATVGEELMRIIPDGERRAVVLICPDRPLLPLFRPYALDRELLFLPPHSSPADLNQLATRYVVTDAWAAQEYPELCNYLEKSGHYELASQRDYTSTLSGGTETWKLYRRIGLTNDVNSPPP
jgi:hypothetical protein